MDNNATPEWWNAHQDPDQYSYGSPHETNDSTRTFIGPARTNGTHTGKYFEANGQSGRDETETGVMDSISTQAPNASSKEADGPQRRPLDYPQLAPEHRYCSRDQIVKPMRAHHCRACARVSVAFL